MTSTVPEQRGTAIPATAAAPSFLVEYLLPRVRLERAHARTLVAVALILGIVTDAMFFEAGGLGINMPLWLGAGVVALILAGRRVGIALTRAQVTVLLAALACSTVVAWRDAGALIAFNLLGCVTLLAFALAMPRGVDTRMPGFVSAIAACLGIALAALTSPFRLGERAPWHTGGRVARLASAISGRALVIALPAFFVFALLFIAADAVFAKQAGQLFDLDLGRLPAHAAWIVVGTWLAVTGLWSGIAVEHAPAIEVDVPEVRRLRATEVGIILGPLVALFAAFVLVQVRYLFGGADLVERSVSLTYAEYARRGFFELVIAALLLLPLLTSVNWARGRDARTKRVFLALGGALVALIFVIMLSAWQRLAMYREAFGLTELRFYTAAMLPWLAVIFTWLAVSIVRERPRWFFPGVVWVSFATLMVLNALNPDALIARTNTGDRVSERPFDAAYAANLSQDAVPPLLARLQALPAADRCALAEWLLPRVAVDEGWRAWNLARRQARAAILEHRAVLEAACTVPTVPQS